MDKLQEMRDLLLQHDRTQGESAAENETRVDKLEQFASGVQALILLTQEEVTHTPQAIQTLIDSTRADNTSSVLRSGSGNERDRPVFDQIDYKIDVLPSQLALGVWKKWKHEVEIHIDTIGPTWRGVKLLMQPARP